MIETKSLFASKTVVASAIAMLAIVAGFFGFSIDTGLQGDILNTVNGVVALVGSAIAIYGRIVASKRIGQG
jgi:hypothetical protein